MDMNSFPSPVYCGTASTPRYQEIYEALKQQIIAGVLREDSRLPSIRKYAEYLNMSTTPVEFAYQQLVAEGFIESRPRRGYFVVKLPETYQKLGIRLRGDVPPASGNPLPLSAGDTTPESHPPDGNPYQFDFHLSKNDFSLFPFSIWRRINNQLFRPDTRDLLFYGDSQGEPELRLEIARYLRQFRGVRCTPDQIVVAAEQHMLIQFLGQVLKESGGLRRVAAEDPGYPLVPNTLRSLGFDVSPIPLDASGLRTDLLRQSGARLAYISPSHQFPTGCVMPVKRRLELLEWAKETDSFLIEDDYGGEFRYAGKPIPSLQGLVPNQHVVYLGGFSQVLAPDFCIHYMVLPEPLVPGFHSWRCNILFEASCSRIHQRTLQVFIQEGHFERHIRRMRSLYRKKNLQLSSAITRHFGSKAAISGSSAGLHLILELSSPEQETGLLRKAKQAGIRIASEAPFWNQRPKQLPPRFLLGFGGIPSDRIDDGILALHQAWSGSE